MAQREGGSSATRPKAKKKAAKPKGQKVDTKALKSAAKAAAAGVKKGAEEVRLSNYRPPSQKDEEAFLIWEGKIKRQGKVIDKLMDGVRTERGAYAQLFAEAKEQGIPADRLRILKATLKEEKRDAGERMTDAREMAWQAQVIKSPVVALGLYDGVLKPPSMEEWEVVGHADGIKGVTSNPPGKPGSPEHTHYISGHKAGQKVLADKTFPQTKPPAPPAGGGGFPPH
jgi:hypothetical protein